jgi:hypothetical protein
MRRLLTSVAVAACLVGTAAVLTGSGPTRQPLRVLQLNLCASGRAACYTGQSLDRADAVVRAVTPDLVTLNEVCEGDVDTLARTFADVFGPDVFSAFQPAPDRPSGEPTRCRDGQEYGIGLLAHGPGEHRTYRGRYPMQDQRDPEERVWLCVGAADRYYACTTHLASTDPTVALAQCHHLMGTAIPDLHRRDGDRPTVVGGDLNLRFGAAPDLSACVPAGYTHFDAGGLLHLMASVRLWSPAVVDMRRTTDHQGLLVTVFVDHK